MDVIVETTKGSGVKFKYDEKHQLFRLLKVLPVGLVFPFDFGFLPGTRGEDGDPLDVMVLSEFTSFPGCVLDCRIIGCLQVKQSKNGTMIRNDRYLAVPEQSRVFENVLSLEDMPSTVVTEIESFFQQYITAEGKMIVFEEPLNAAMAMQKLGREGSLS